MKFAVLLLTNNIIDWTKSRYSYEINVYLLIIIFLRRVYSPWGNILDLARL